MSNPNQQFKDQKDGEEPWEPFFDCLAFASEDCEGDCDHCDEPKDTIELLCQVKW